METNKSIEDFRNEKDLLFEIEKQFATLRIFAFKKMLRSLIDEFKAVVRDEKTQII